MAPAEIICISITPGNTSAMPASASVPSFATNQVSISPVAACANMTSTFGHAIRSSVGTIGPCSSTRVRGFMAAAGASARAAETAGRFPSRAATLMGCSACARRHVRLSPERARRPLARALARSMHIVVACARRQQAPGQMAYSGALIGRPVALSTMIGSTAAPVCGIDQLHARALGREVLVAPGEQGDQHGTEIAPARGRHVFVARRTLAVAPALQQSRLDQGIEPARQHVGRDAEALLELVEPRAAVQRVAQDQDAPPFAHPLQAAGDRARHAVEVFALH